MRLVRNLTADGVGKFTVINNVTGKTMESRPGDPDEFFVIKLKDRHSEAALRAYAGSIRSSDPEFAAEVDELAGRAGKNSPFCKDPD